MVATYRDGRRHAIWHRDGTAGLGEFARLRVRGEGYRLAAPSARIAILLSADTASAGEVVALAFRGVGVRSFGAATAGSTTGTRTFVLPDGAELVLAVATMSGRDGTETTGALQPDVAVAPGARGRPLAEQPEIRAALAWLGCGEP